MRANVSVGKKPKQYGLYITTRGTDGNTVHALCRTVDKSTGKTANEILPVRFFNWMYAVPSDSLALAKAQDAVKQFRIQNKDSIQYAGLVYDAVFSSSPPKQGGDVLADHKVGITCLRVYYYEKARALVKACLERSGCVVYESDITLEWRFVCHHKLSLFCPIVYENFALQRVENCKESDSLRAAEIPILYFMLGQPQLLFWVNISKEIISLRQAPLGEKVNDPDSIALWICWGEKDANPQTNGGISCYGKRYLIFLRQVIYKLFDANANRNANKQVMHPYNMAAFETRCGIDLVNSAEQRGIIAEIITGLIGISTQIPCTLDALTRRKSKKTVADAILCSQCRPNTILEAPERLPKFESMAVIKKCEDFAKASDLEEIWLLDFVSHYPNIILALSERCPRLEYAGKAIRHFLRLKGMASGMLRSVYKLVLNGWYGTMGIKDPERQGFIRTLIEIGALICSTSHQIMTSAIAICERCGVKIMHTHTDSLIIRGPPLELARAQREINEMIATSSPRLSYTTLELKEKIQSVAIFNATDMFYVDSQGVGHGIGHCFNTIMIPEYCRLQILDAFGEILRKSTSTAEIYTHFISFQQELRKNADAERIKKLKTFVPLRALVSYYPNSISVPKDSCEMVQKDVKELARENFKRREKDGGYAQDYYVSLTDSTGCMREEKPFAEFAKFGFAKGLPEYTSLMTLTFVHKEYRNYMSKKFA